MIMPWGTLCSQCQDPVAATVVSCLGSAGTIIADKALEQISHLALAIDQDCGPDKGVLPARLGMENDIATSNTRVRIQLKTLGTYSYKLLCRTVPLQTAIFRLFFFTGQPVEGKRSLSLRRGWDMGRTGEEKAGMTRADNNVYVSPGTVNAGVAHLSSMPWASPIALSRHAAAGEALRNSRSRKSVQSARASSRSDASKAKFREEEHGTLTRSQPQQQGSCLLMLPAPHSDLGVRNC